MGQNTSDGPSSNQTAEKKNGSFFHVYVLFKECKYILIGSLLKKYRCSYFVFVK